MMAFRVVGLQIGIALDQDLRDEARDGDDGVALGAPSVAGRS